MEQPKVHYLSDYKPYPYNIVSVDLTFDLYESHTLVRNVMQIAYNGLTPAALPPLELDGRHLTLEEILFDDTPLTTADYRLENGKLSLTPDRSAFRLEMVTRIHPQDNTALEGLYKSGDMFCTQCESEGFRRITYFPDRPDVMAAYTCTLVADRKTYPVLLSNGNRVQTGTLGNNRHWAKWSDPFKKPCYLFALVAGDLYCHQDRFETRSGKKVAIEIYVEPSDRDKCEHAAAALKRAMQWDEIHYGREYDLDIYMIVAVHHFNMGAMENKGLNIFNAQYVLAHPDTATDMDYDNIQAVIAHEYFHNWTGNRITLRNWFQLSLKEGLTVFRDQQFTADMTSAAVKRIQDVKKLRQLQFPEDAGPMAHPVRPDAYIQMNNFYTHTVYEKGAEVIRMLHTLLGADIFRRGMDLYFETYDGQAVTTDDFLEVMQRASGRDLKQFRRWYLQAGTPLLKVAPHYDAQTASYTLVIEQSISTQPPEKAFGPLLIPIRVGLIDTQGRPYPLHLSGAPTSNETSEKTPGPTEIVLELNQQRQEFRFENIESQPTPSLLRHFSAPVKLETDFDTHELVFLMHHDGDLFNRWDACQTLLNRMYLSMICACQQNKEVRVSSDIIDGFRKLLAEAHQDRLFTSLMLTLPSQIEIANAVIDQGWIVDPEAIAVARQTSVQAISEHMSSDIETHYIELHARADNSLDRDSIASRRLKNSLLYFLAHSQQTSHQDLVFDQLTQAANLTDALGALSVVADMDHPDTDPALTHFYQKWQSQTLVVDKWLAVQSASQRPDVISRINALGEHSSFSIKNPNKVRALIGTFGFMNHRWFHESSGSGYKLLADRIIALNTLNPQIAARLATVFNHWNCYDEQRQTLMKQELKRIAETPRISDNLYEIVTKILAAE